MAHFPAGIDPGKTIFVDPVFRADQQSFRAQLTSGFSVSLLGTYGEQFQSLRGSFHIPEGDSFVGEGVVWNGEGQSTGYFISCTLNYVQMPCAQDRPARGFTHRIGPREEFHFPVKIRVEGKGMHDLAVLVVQDPYPAAEPDHQELLHTSITESVYNIFVGDSTHAPRPKTVSPAIRLGSAPNSYLWISSEANPFQGSSEITVWLNASASPGAFVPFVLNFGKGSAFDFFPLDLVVSAYVDGQQVPFLLEQNQYQPLFVQKRPFAWQSLEASVRAPTEPGDHLLLLTVRPNPFARNEMNGQYVNQAFTEATQRILIKVE